MTARAMSQPRQYGVGVVGSAGVVTLEDRPHMSGLKDVIRVDTRSGVQIVMSVDTQNVPRESPSSLRVVMIIPEGVKVALRGSSATVESTEWTDRKELPIRRIIGPGQEIYGPTAVLEGKTQREKHWFATYTYPSEFLVGFAEPPTFKLSLPPAHSFTFYFPEMFVNGTVARIEPVRFDAYTRSGVMWRP